MKMYISIDKKYKTGDAVEKQIQDAITDAEKILKDKITVVHALDKADCAYFVDEWEDDIQCYNEHNYCIENNVKIVHDKSEFWNRLT